MDHSQFNNRSGFDLSSVDTPADSRDPAAGAAQLSLDQTLDSAPRVDGKLQLQAAGVALDPALVRLHQLLVLPPVELPNGFTQTVMLRVEAQRVEEERVERERVTSHEKRPSSARASWLYAVVGAAGLFLTIGMLGGTGPGGDSLFGGIAGGFASVVLAGAGMLAATWSGVGSSVGSWLGTSPTVGAFLALAFFGSALGVVVGVRRARQRS